MTTSTQTTQTRQTFSQRRAAHAWSFIQYALKHEENGKKKYVIVKQESSNQTIATEAGKKLGTEIKKLPTRIIASGLGQAIAFLHAKEAEPLLEQAIAQWLLCDRPQAFYHNFKMNGELVDGALLIEHILATDAATLRDLTAESLAYLPWLGRFAEGVGLMEKPDNVSVRI